MSLVVKSTQFFALAAGDAVTNASDMYRWSGRHLWEVVGRGHYRGGGGIIMLTDQSQAARIGALPLVKSSMCIVGHRVFAALSTR
jgi:hypothetical protein